MNPAQLLNPKGFAKQEKEKAKKRTPNYGTSFSTSLVCPIGFTPSSTTKSGEDRRHMLCEVATTAAATITSFDLRA